jgi:metal-responsive CopG/Arc/MetJ family transcriptional regulator
MAKVKTAISIQASLFRDVDVMAHKMHVSRSQLFSRAMGDFIQKQQNRQLLEQINAAYDQAPDPEERKWQGRARNRQRRLVEGQW